MRQNGEQRRSCVNGSETPCVVFELFVQRGYSDLELASVVETLRLANDVLGEERYMWRFVSDQPGLVQGACGTKVRAEPEVPDHRLSDWMIVIGGTEAKPDAWLKRLRSMRREALGVVLLSRSAAIYIKETQANDGPVTTHWRDASVLHETGHYPNLSTRLSEKSAGVITSAGGGATAELIVGLLADTLEANEISELGNRLLLPIIRKSNAEQPKTVGDNPSLFEPRISRVIQSMEETIDNPQPIAVLTKAAGISTRHLERTFKAVLKTSPCKFYKRIRVRRARQYIDETQMPLAEIAAATGFTSANSLSRAIRSEYGIAPVLLRRRRTASFLEYQH